MGDYKIFDSAGVEIAYIDTGAARRETPVLLIHGFASNAAMNWIGTGWVDALSQDGYRVVAFDNRGHGRSQKLYELTDYGAPLMAEDARRLLDHLGIGRAHVAGYSMGSRISAFLAVAHPERVQSLVFGGLGINMVRGVGGTGPIAHALEADSIDEVTNPTARTFRAFAERTKSDLKALAACIRSSRAPMTAEMVAGIKVPVLVAVAEGDVVAGPPEELAKLMADARVLTIPTPDHNRAVGDKTFKAGAMSFLGSLSPRGEG